MHAAHVNYVHLSIVINVTLSFFWQEFENISHRDWLHLESTQIIAWFLCYTVSKRKRKKIEQFFNVLFGQFFGDELIDLSLSTNAPVAVILDLVMLWGKNSKIVFIVWGNNILINGKTNCNKNRDDPNARYIII